MTKQHFVLNAEIRTDLGRSASRCLRRNEKIPAVIYGAGKEPVSITLDHNKILHALEHEAFYSSILEIKIGAKTEKAVLKDLQRHAYKPKIAHVDFLRVDGNVEIHMHVPLHFIGECPAVKTGGVMNHLVNEVEVVCLPGNLPEYIEVDISGLQLDHTIHLSQLALPKGVKLAELAHDNDAGVVNVHIPRALKAEDDQAGAPTAPAVPTVKDTEEPSDSAKK
ncbi:MAG: 50S ribosomal protein L25/general stress protein Ctc [Gammaproteobacteria bacterium]|jgi:large subunit ribosomal protein L25|nr:50S ribosomal protein L25/general stress protein Ctc [Gammaproteobacteria bacterium]